RLAGASGRDAEQIQELLAGYREQLESFTGYRTELQEFYAADDLGDDGFAEQFSDLFGEDLSTIEIRRLNTILEVVQNRIAWLENLRSDNETLARLRESTGMDLTVETINRIIEATRQQVLFIQRQIQIMEGPQASAEPAAPLFVAETG